MLQAITIDADRFESYRQSPDFIQRHVFRAGMLPTRERHRAGGRESWAYVFVLRAFRRELRANPLGVAAAFPGFAENWLKP